LPDAFSDSKSVLFGNVNGHGRAAQIDHRETQKNRDENAAVVMTG
jgi:hypothetical protein